MFTYEQIARQLKIPRGTLSRKLAQHNRQSAEPIKPDKVEDKGHYRIHRFSAETVDKIEAAVKNLKSQKRGRPALTHQPARRTP